MKRRSALQTLLITVAVVASLLVCSQMIARRRGADAATRMRANRPDITLVDVGPERLAAAGYRLDARSPKSWRDISVRLFENDQGFINLLRCRINAGEAQELLIFPPDARRSRDGQPPADWPRGKEGDNFTVPAWWKPSGKRSRYAEQLAPGTPARGIYADFDPDTGWYHCWTWSRNDTRLQRPDLLSGMVCDELASGLADLAITNAWPRDAEGWLSTDGLGRLECGALAKRLPSGIERIDARLLPLAGRHRYVLRVVGLELQTARQMIGEVPMRELPDASIAPSALWNAALPPGGLPAWFTPAAGRRWAYCLVRIGDGAVECGRWAAYSEAERTLYVWDWEGPSALPASADLTP